MIVKRDVFPAVVKFVSGNSTHELTICRVVQTNDSVIVVQDSGSGPITVFEGTIIGTASWNGTDGSIDTTVGTRVEYTKDSACGCGSRLRSWNPYRNIVSSTQDPTS